MAILNITPDSFYQTEELAHISESPQAAIDLAARFIEQGAHILDIGGMSSKPGAELISASEELDRVIPVIEALFKAFPTTPISIDTVHSSVCQAAAKAGAGILNDISAGKFDDNLIPIAAKYGMPYILMHMQGKPQEMQEKPSYENVVTSVFDFFSSNSSLCLKAGIKDLILDPGFGFGKTIDHNYKLLGSLSVFETLGFPILAGVSRKSMIWKVLNVEPDQALHGTGVLHTLALIQGALLLRVHDPKEATQVCTLVDTYSRAMHSDD